MRAFSGKYFARATVVFGSIGILVWPAIGAENPASIPDFSGLWAHPFLGFESPVSGPGPVRNLSRLPSGASNFGLLVGDYTNPILKPEAADVVKNKNDTSAATGPVIRRCCMTDSKCGIEASNA